MALDDAQRLQIVAMALMRHSVVGGGGGTPAESLIKYKEKLTPMNFVSCAYSRSGLYSGDAVPVMTSYTNPSGTVTSSGESSSSYRAWYAFDSKTSSYWYPNSNAAWIAYEFTAAKTIKAYSITTTSASYSPLGWTFEGWDGSGWVVIDTQSVPAFLGKRFFECSNNTAYIKYQISISLATTSWARISNIELLEGI